MFIVPIIAVFFGTFSGVGNAYATDYPFSIRTSSIEVDGTFTFSMTAKGTFYIDCGTGGTLSSTAGDVSGETITRTNTTAATYTCTYSTAGIKTIQFGGRATGYSGSDNATVISFENNTLITNLYGNLSELFPVINSGSYHDVRFIYTFSGCTNLTSIPETLFENYISLQRKMFLGTFNGCTSLTSIPGLLFANIVNASYDISRYAFEQTFAGCTGLMSLPPYLFANIPGISQRIFYQTFNGCSGLTGYIPTTFFEKLIENGSNTNNNESNIMQYMFDGTGLSTTCPNGMIQYITGYEGYWGGKVSCAGSYVCNAGTYLPANSTSCVTCPTGKNCTGGQFATSNVDQGIFGCAEGYYKNGNNCFACGINSYTTNGNNWETCTCVTGSSANGVSGGATTSTNGCIAYSCPAGTYLPANTQSCATCRENFYCPGGNVSVSNNSNDQGMPGCRAGYYKSGNNCVACGLNSFTTNGNNDTSCACISGYTADGLPNGPTTSTTGCSPTVTCQTDEINLGSRCVDSKFSITTTNMPLNSTFSFSLRAKGTFYVSCGDNGILSGTGVSGNTIASSSTNLITYTCTYSTGGIKVIRFAGVATGYSSETNCVATLSFENKEYIASLDGNLSVIFPLVDDRVGSKNVKYCNTFANCVNLTYIPETLFADYTKTTRYIFAGTFSNCTSLTSIPDGLFANIVNGSYNDSRYSFQSMFSGCTGLTSLPPYLFANIPSISLSIFNSTFSGCSGLTGYIPPTFFAKLIENGSWTNNNETSIMQNIFGGTGLLSTCPNGMIQYITGYERYFGGKVSCEPGSKITYDCEGGTGTAPANTGVKPNASFTPADNTCSKTGYTFAGWKVSGTEDIKQPGTAFTWTYTDDKTLTAQWTANSLDLTWYKEDGTTVVSDTPNCTYGQTFTGLPTPPEKLGYHFKKWNVKQ